MLAAGVLVASCASVPVEVEPPKQLPIEPEIPPTADPVWFPDQAPREEPLSYRGNSLYRVGKDIYRVWRHVDSYVAEGTAVRRGDEYLGRETLNGEQFDLDSLVAAHRHLAIPSYVRVTNQDNDLSIVVRVNDRGPFYGDHVISLSRAAALKLGFGEVDSRPVRIELISQNVPEYVLETNYVYGKDAAMEVVSRLVELNLGHLSTAIVPHQYENRFRVRIGQFASIGDARHVSEWLLSNLQLRSLVLKD